MSWYDHEQRHTLSDYDLMKGIIAQTNETKRQQQQQQQQQSTRVQFQEETTEPILDFLSTCTCLYSCLTTV